MLKNNMNENYNFEIDNDNFENQKLLQETKTILAYLYLNYWGTDEKKKIIKQKFKQDILQEEEKKKLQYDSNELFKKDERFNKHVER